MERVFWFVRGSFFVPFGKIDGFPKKVKETFGEVFLLREPGKSNPNLHTFAKIKNWVDTFKGFVFIFKPSKNDFPLQFLILNGCTFQF